MRRFLLLLMACFSVIALLSTSSQAQDTATAKWAKAVANQPLVFSNDGSTIMTTDFTSVRAWSTTTSKLIAVTGVSLVSYVPSATGNGFFYGTGDTPSKTFFFNFATRTSTLIREDSAGYSGAHLMALSANGAKIAIKTYNPSNSRYYLVVFNSATGAQLARIGLPPGFDTQQIAFCNGDTRILCGGMRLHPANGTSGAAIGARQAAGTQIHRFTLSPDRTKAYGVDESGTLVGLDLTAASSLPEVFSAPATAANAFLQCTSDGNALISTGSSPDFTQQAFRSYSTTTGAQLPGSINIPNGSLLGYFAVSPFTNQLVTFLSANGHVYRRFSFNTSDGTGTQLSDFSEGIGGNTISNFGTIANPLLLHYDSGVYSSRLRNATTGDVLGQYNAEAVFSPDGQYYAVLGGALLIYRASDGMPMASMTISDSYRMGWANNGRVWVRTSNAGDENIAIYDFSGSALTHVRTLPSATWNSRVSMSANGLRLVEVNLETPVAKVYNVDTGNLVGTINHTGSAYTGLLQSSKAVGNTLMIHEWNYNGSTVWTNVARFHDLMDDALPQVAIASYTQGVYPHVDGQASSTPDGSLVAFTMGQGQTSDNRIIQNMIAVVRVKDNTVIKRYADQFGVDGWSGAGISVDGATLVTNSYYGDILVGIDLPAVLTNVSVSPAYVVGGNSATGTVTLSRPAPAGGTVVALSASSGLTVPATVTVAQGNTTANFTVATLAVSANTVKTITATYDGLPLQAQFTVTPPTAFTITFSPNTVNPGQSSTGTITLNGPAGPGGLTVNLSSDKAYVTVPVSAHFTSGQTSKTFTANTTDPGTTDTATVTGIWGTVTGTGTLNVNSIGANVAFDVSSIVGGNALVLTVTMVNPAPAGGATFTFTGDAVINPWPSVTIPEGLTTTTVGIDTNTVSTDTPGILTVTRNGSNRTVQATVTAPTVLSVTSAVNSITGVKTFKATVTLTGPAPAGGMVLAVSLNNTTVTTPTTVTVPAGQASVTFDVTSKKQTTPKLVNITIGAKVLKLNLRPAP